MGYLPKCADVEIPCRHLGLSLDEDFCFEEFADRVAELVEKYVDIDRLLELTKQVAPAALPMSVSHRTYRREPSFTVAIARDPAFNFMYEANIRYLHHLGEVTYFSPLADTSLPDAVLFIFPEVIRSYIWLLYRQTGRCFNPFAGMSRMGESCWPNVAV